MPFLGGLSPSHKLLHTQSMTATNIPAWRLQDRLRRALDEGGVSAQGMAELLGVSRNTISNYLNGHTRLNPSQLREWARFCHVDPDWLAGEDIPGIRRIRSRVTQGVTLGYRFARARDLGLYGAPAFA